MEKKKQHCKEIVDFFYVIGMNRLPNFSFILPPSKLKFSGQYMCGVMMQRRALSRDNIPYQHASPPNRSGEAPD